MFISTFTAVTIFQLVASRTIWTLARDRQVLVSRGESVEIGGGFRVPDVMEQSGAHLVDVGTTNRTRLSDYQKAIARRHADVALVLKVHPSNYAIAGFTAAADPVALHALCR